MAGLAYEKILFLFPPLFAVPLMVGLTLMSLVFATDWLYYGALKGTVTTRTTRPKTRAHVDSERAYLANRLAHVFGSETSGQVYRGRTRRDDLCADRPVVDAACPSEFPARGVGLP